MPAFERSTPSQPAPARRHRPLAPVLGAWLAIALAGCAAPPAAQAPQPPASQAEQDALNQARGVAAKVPANLLQVLTTEIDKGGPTAAIAACNVKAPAMARTASEQTGWQVRRASQRNRNPKGVPDAWELAALKKFDMQVAAGANPATLETWEVVDEGGKRVMRYAKALPTQSLCLQCHGSADKLGVGVPAKLHEMYPADRATGYDVGQIRGGLFLKKAL